MAQSKNDKDYFQKLGKALDKTAGRSAVDAVKRKRDLSAYLSFIDQGIELMSALKGKLQPSNALGVENVHRQARKLNLLRRYG